LPVAVAVEDMAAVAVAAPVAYFMTLPMPLIFRSMELLSALAVLAETTARPRLLVAVVLAVIQFLTTWTRPAVVAAVLKMAYSLRMAALAVARQIPPELLAPALPARAMLAVKNPAMLAVAVAVRVKLAAMRPQVLVAMAATVWLMIFPAQAFITLAAVAVVITLESSAVTVVLVVAVLVIAILRPLAKMEKAAVAAVPLT
jgi:hypothetical protein